MLLVTIMLNILFIFLLTISSTFSSILRNNEQTTYPEILLPEFSLEPHVNKTKRTLLSIDDNITFNEIQLIQQTIEKVKPVLCFSEETIKETPSLAILCFVFGLIWLCLILALCFSTLKQILERIQNFGSNGFRNNRSNFMVNKSRSQNFPGLLSFRQDSDTNKISCSNDCK
jgi:hypothetical protein